MCAGLMDTVPTARARKKGVDVKRVDYRIPGAEEADESKTYDFQLIFIPFKERNLLYEHIHREWRRNPNFISHEPNLTTFYYALRSPELKARLRFMIVSQQALQMHACRESLMLRAGFNQFGKI